MKKYTYEILSRAIDEKGIEHVRNAVFPQGVNEFIGMSMYIDSRQTWCKNRILNKIDGGNRKETV